VRVATARTSLILNGVPDSGVGVREMAVGLLFNKAVFPSPIPHPASRVLPMTVQKNRLQPHRRGPVVVVFQAVADVQARYWLGLGWSLTAFASCSLALRSGVG
jgi:hypothetical protein